MLRNQLQIINGLNLFLSKSKCYNLNARFFHSSDILNMDKGNNDLLSLEAQSKTLDVNSELQDIVLSEIELSKLKANLVELKKINNENTSFDFISNNEISSFKEAFPNYGNNTNKLNEKVENLNSTVELLSKISGKDKLEIKQLIEEEGIFNCINKISNDPSFQATLSGKDNNPEISTNLQGIISDCEDKVDKMSNELANLSNNVEDLMNVKSKI